MTNETREYIKKPIVVEAYKTEEKVEIETLEGTMTANPGDYIITGVHGEKYPCKPDIFHETYELFEIEKCECEEEPPKMGVYMDVYNVNEMFREASDIIRHADKGHVFIVFGMGSVRLDISNPKNMLEINKDYVEIFNDENGEITMIKIDEVTGFVFEPAIESFIPDETCLEEEVENEDD